MSLQTSGRTEIIKGNIDLLDDDIKIMLVTNSSSSWEFVSDIPAESRVATSGNLASKTLTNTIAGTVAFDAADVLFEDLTGDSIGDIVLYKDTGSESTSPIIWTNYFSFTPVGTDMTVVWDSDQDRIFRVYKNGGTNEIYTSARMSFLKGEIDVLNDTIKVALLDSTYSFDVDVDDFYDDISASVVAEAALSGKQIDSNGYFNASNLTFASLTGSVITQYVVYKDTGTPGTSPLICRAGTADYGLPYTPDGEDMVLAFEQNSGIFRF